MASSVQSPIQSGVRHPNAVVLPPPFRVSPFIRFCRYAALGAGILYGSLRFSYLKRKHTKVRQYEHEKEVIADYQAYRQREIRNKENVVALLKEAGLPLDENMKKQFNIVDIE